MPARTDKHAEITLTKGEQAALLDRLSLAANVAEVLCDTECDALETWHPEDIESECRALENYVGQQSAIPRDRTPLQNAILVEAVEGSTYAAGFESHEHGKRNGAARVLRSLADKLIAAGVADRIDVPTA